jgi:DNA-directed RNA polymerase specialized sigma24 family protein
MYACAQHVLTRTNNVMIHVAPRHIAPEASDLAGLACEHLDDLVTYATHLTGTPDDAIEFVAGGLAHAAKYPPTRLRVDGRAALYRAVTRACRQQHRFPPRPQGPGRFLRRPRSAYHAEFDSEAASKMNTVKRALMTIPFERRAALLLHDLAGLDYREMSRAMECSPEAAGRLLAAARRDFGTIYTEIAL